MICEKGCKFMAKKIDEQEFLDHVSEKILKGEKITMDEDLLEIKAWDSLSSVSFLAMADLDYDSKVNPLEAKNAITVRDVYNLVCEGIED